MNLITLFESTNEGYTVTRGIDKERYQERAGLEGPFQTKSGKVVYYDKKEGKYYDPDSDMYIDHDDYAALDESVQDYIKGVVLAGLLGLGINQAADMASAKNSPLGQAMAQAAEQGDQYAAKHLKKLDFYMDAGDTGSIKILSQKYLGRTVESVMEEELASNKRTERILKLLRAKNPSAENDLEALILSFDKGQKMDRDDINTLYSQNREEDREIEELERELEALKKRRSMKEESNKERAERAAMDNVKAMLAQKKADAAKQPKAEPKQPKADPHADKSTIWKKGYADGKRGIMDPKASDAYGPRTGEYEAGYSAGMKAKEVTNEDYYSTDEQRELARLGRILMDMGAKRDDDVGAAMGAVGNELTKYGSPEGVSTIEKLEKVTGQPESVIMKMMALAQKVQGDVAVGADVEDEEEIEEADFDKNFSKRIGYTVKGGAAADMMKKQAAQAQADNPDAGKGLGPGVLDIAKARKKAKEKGVRAPGNLRASPNTRDPKRLPEEARRRTSVLDGDDIKIGDIVQTLKGGQMQGVVTGFSTKTGDKRVMFKHKSGKVYATYPENLLILKGVEESVKKSESQVAENIDLRHDLKPGTYKHKLQNIQVSIDNNGSVTFMQPAQWEIEGDQEYLEYVESQLAMPEYWDAELDEAKKKPVPTKPDKWAYAKAQAKKKFDVYPSAYANAWAAKKYKELGGGWRMGKKK